METWIARQQLKRIEPIDDLARFGRPDLVVADRWREAELRDALEAAGVPPAALDVRGMGYRDGAEDVRHPRMR